VTVAVVLAIEGRSRLEHVVYAPHGPHTGGKVRIKVAMENRVAHRLIAVAAAVIDHLERERGAGAQELTVQIAAVLAVRRMQPLVRVLVMDVRKFASRVQD